MIQPVDTLFIHAHLLTMAGGGVGYVEDGAVAVRAGAIVETGSTPDLVQRYEPKERVDATEYALLPGLIDAHVHSSLAVVRGVAQDVAHWMQKALAPYTRNFDAKGTLAGTRLTILEGIRAGTTTFGDFERPFEGWPEAYLDTGARARLTPTINALPEEGMAGLEVGELYPLDAKRAGESINIALDFAKTWNNEGNRRLSVMMGPQAPDMLARDELIRVKELASREGLMVHMHVAQGDREIDQMLKRYGQRTPEFLDELGYLDDQLLAVHLTEASDEETIMIAESGAGMALCSGSIAIIDGIVPPSRIFRQVGGHVALGSDQAAGNNCCNIFNEMKLTALFNKIRHRDPEAMQAGEVLRMATIEGATALGLNKQIGSIEAGKRADLIMVDLTHPRLCPLLTDPIRNLVPNLVYAACGDEVSSVMVDGVFLMRERQLTTLDEEKIRADAQRCAELISQRVSKDPLREDLVLLDVMAAGQL